ncbi:MAG: type III secretion system cytoplasmic ring protein SctQ [Puniceicoccales bacterium]|jgi:type III secretion system YscQ/HrcQ family protein|nr:type III secretion system cytoplasmic ring protein SctQ [Puniceicoccales bacterium]
MDKFKPKIQLCPQCVQLLNAWITPSQAHCTSNDHTYHFELSPAIGEQTIATLTYRWENQDLNIGLLNSSFLSFLDPQFEDLHWETCDPEIQTCLLDACHAFVAELLNQFNVSSIELGQVQFTTTEIQNGLATLYIVEDKNKCALQLFNDDASTLFLQRVSSNILAPNPNFNIHQLPLIFRIERGCTRISIDELKQLRTGDILLTQERVRAQNDLVRFHAHHLTFWAKQVALNQFAIQTPLMDETNDLPAGIIPEDDIKTPEDVATEVPVSDTSTEDEKSQSDQKPQSAVINLDQLPIHITFDAGEKILSLDEIKNLHVGYTFETDHAIDDPVKIKANGKIIGEGEWVCINEHFGVRITQLNS